MHQLNPPHLNIYPHKQGISTHFDFLKSLNRSPSVSTSARDVVKKSQGCKVFFCHALLTEARVLTTALKDFLFGLSEKDALGLFHHSKCAACSSFACSEFCFGGCRVWILAPFAFTKGCYCCFKGSSSVFLQRHVSSGVCWVQTHL